MAMKKNPPRVKLPSKWTAAKVRVNSNGKVQIAINPAKLERCVKKVAKKKGVKSAYAICKASMKRKNRRRK